MDPEALGVKRFCAWLAPLLLGACFNTPTPLAPGVRGTVGAPNSGVLTDAVELPVRGEGFERYRPRSSHYFGRPGLVSALQGAAASVARARPGGAPLSIGDLSAQTGGRIPGHDSHRTGRDVDLLFLVTTPSGAPVPSPGFVRFEGDGLARVQDTGDYVRLDVDREWLLLRALLTSPDIGVQFMFVCHEIEALLIDHARALGEPDALIWQAETVMLEPSDSLKHDDHVHLRVACAPEETVSGCTGGGPRWQWLPALSSPTPLDALAWDEISKNDPFELDSRDP